MAESEWVSVSEAVRLSGLSTRTLKRMAKEGRLRFSRSPGGHWRIARVELDRLLNHPTRAAAAPASNVQQRKERVEELVLQGQELRINREIEKLREEDREVEQRRTEAQRAEALANERMLAELRLQRQQQTERRARERREAKLARQAEERRAELVEQSVSEILPGYSTAVEKAKALADARIVIASIPEAAADWEVRALLAEALEPHRDFVVKRKAEENVVVWLTQIMLNGR